MEQGAQQWEDGLQNGKALVPTYKTVLGSQWHGRATIKCGIP